MAQSKRPPALKFPTKPEQRDQTVDDIFTRLQKRGVEYTLVKRVVQFERPHDTLFFAQWFKGRTFPQVLRQLCEWKALLKKDFVLSLSKDLKSQVEQWVLRTELLVWRALIEANSRVGPWDLDIRLVPTGQHENGHAVFIHPDREIVAVHRQSKETRRARLPGDPSRPLDLQAEDHRRAFQELGLWDQLWKGDPSRVWISKHQQRAWPLFTQLIIPRLYECMAPEYKSPGHYSPKLDGAAAETKRPALLPKELLQDMLEILKMEHDYAFRNATLPQLKAHLQRYLAKKKGQAAPSK